MKKFIFIIIIFLLTVFLYGKYIEVNNFKIKEYTIKNDKIPNSFKELKIIHFSDVLYVSNSKTKLNNLVEQINKNKPDIIIFTGDLFKSDIKYTNEDFDYLKESFNKLEASLYKYAVIGDNDKDYIENYKIFYMSLILIY